MNALINPSKSGNELAANPRSVPATNRYQQVTAPLVTALHATKIAPAIFFALEKLAAALETLKNDQNSHTAPLTNAPKGDNIPLPPAPSNRISNLLIGSGITTVSLGVAYVAASYFKILPGSLNFFGNSNEPNTPPIRLDSESTDLSDKYYWVPDESGNCYGVLCTNPKGCVNDPDCIEPDLTKPNHRWVSNPSTENCNAMPCINSENCLSDLDCIDHFWAFDKESGDCYPVHCTNSEDCVDDPDCNETEEDEPSSPDDNIGTCWLRKDDNSDKCEEYYCTDPTDCESDPGCPAATLLSTESE